MLGLVWVPCVLIDPAGPWCTFALGHGTVAGTCESKVNVN
jgi:hypothetical protein